MKAIIGNIICPSHHELSMAQGPKGCKFKRVLNLLPPSGRAS
jgi:hypothetical protein